MKNKSHLKVTFKWSSVDQVLLPALSGVVKTYILTLQRYIFFLKVPNFRAANAMNACIFLSFSCFF